MHGDDIVMSRHLQRPHAPMMVTSMWALTDFTADNGGTRFVPGSHRFRAQRRRPGRARRCRRACTRDAGGLGDDLPRLAVARRRREHDRRRVAPRRQRAVLPGLRAPAAEPVPRHPARDRGRVLRPLARAARLPLVQGDHGPRRRPQPRRGRVRRPDGRDRVPRQRAARDRADAGRFEFLPTFLPTSPAIADRRSMFGEWYDEDAIHVVAVGRGCSLDDGRHFLVLSVELWLEAIVVQFAVRRVPGSYDESLPIAVVSLEDDTGYRYAGLEPSVRGDRGVAAHDGARDGHAVVTRVHPRDPARGHDAVREARRRRDDPRRPVLTRQSSACVAISSCRRPARGTTARGRCARGGRHVRRWGRA